MLTTGVPTLSSIQVWGVEHLTQAANHWTATADRWENTFVQVWQQSRAVPWNGHGANALHERTSTDKMTAVRKADQLREAATIARRGASDISAAQRRVMYAIEDAYNAGFNVGQDLSVTDTGTSRDAVTQAARQAQAQAFAADIRSRAAELVGVDNEVGGNLTAAAGDVGDTTFTEKPIHTPGKDGTIQLVGFGAKQDTPPPAPPPAPAVPSSCHREPNLRQCRSSTPRRRTTRRSITAVLGRSQKTRRSPWAAPRVSRLVLPAKYRLWAPRRPRS